ncbi:hypothetical protein OQA88_2289 [Cercophora sp. LCS_1]
MTTYGFDGVDLDWEYPRAEDRGGRDMDYANFPKFMSRLKAGLAVSGGRKDISITLPCSYWYLQHFDLRALVKEISWFNIMSYDMHGTWDKTNKWVGPYLNAHTNLTEIMELGLYLLWRNQVPPDKVVLGTAFYGRAFTASSPSCVQPGCMYESGAGPGRCSKEPGILMNSEIDDVVKQKGIRPQWDKSSAVKIASWGNQWVAYDDEDTLRQKSETAQELCLGGLMVWAITHDTADAKYSRALAKVSNRIRGPQEFSDYDPYTSVKTLVRQRSDKDACGEEYMFDNQHCDGGRSHLFCCPTEAPLPKCGWYTHHNGKCDPQCPSGTIEIGSNNMHCNNGKYQAACCTFDTKSMRAYANCEWGPWPNCDNAKRCPWADGSKFALTTQSSTGSGGAYCLPNRDGIYTSRVYCCNNQNEENRWGFCQGYSTIGLADSDKNVNNYCWSGCPDDTTRIAMNRNIRACAGKEGAAAVCCPTWTYDRKLIENPILAQYRTSANNFANNPTCYANGLGGLSTRSDSSIRALDSRQENSEASDAIATAGLLLGLLTKSHGSQAMRDAALLIWDNTVGAKFRNLKYALLSAFLEALEVWKTVGPLELAHRITCSPHMWNMRVGRGGGGPNQPGTLGCSHDFCTPPSNEDPEGVCYDAENPPSASRGSTGLTKSLPQARSLEKRARQYRAQISDANGRMRTITLTLDRHTPAGEFDFHNPIYDEALDFTDPDDCGDATLAAVSNPHLYNGELREFQNGVLVREFIEQAARGVLPSGATMRAGAISASFFLEHVPTPILNAPPSASDRYATNKDFVLVYEFINGHKSLVVRGVDIVEKSKWEGYVSNMDNPNEALSKIRLTIAVILYMGRTSNPPVQPRLAHVVTLIHAEWRRAEIQWNARHPNDQVRVADAWAEWARAQQAFSEERAIGWVTQAILDMRRRWAVRTGEGALGVMEALRRLEDQIPNVIISAAGFPA